VPASQQQQQQQLEQQQQHKGAAWMDPLTIEILSIALPVSRSKADGLAAKHSVQSTSCLWLWEVSPHPVSPVTHVSPLLSHTTIIADAGDTGG
jgi:hypothetical protein